MIALDRSMDNPEFQSDISYVTKTIVHSAVMSISEHTTIYLLENEIRHFISALPIESLLSISVGVVLDAEIANGGRCCPIFGCLCL
jgi:hypothetical protein